MELPWPENLANTYARHTEPLNSCFDLIGEDHFIHYWWDLIRLKQLSSGFVRRAQVFGGFSGHSNWIYDIIPLLKKKKKKKKKM